MSDRQTDDDRRRRITTDRDTIRGWADERNAVPAYREDAETGRQHRFFREGEIEEGYQERNWDTFFDDFESNEHAFVYHEDADTVDSHEIIARDEAAARATVSDADVEERLVEGETVTTEVTETTVVEREIVETETIESEVTDRRPVRSRVTDAELVDWEVVDTDVDLDLRASDESIDHEVDLRGDTPDYASLDLWTTAAGDVTAEVEERWRIDRETEERLTVESRVVDVDVEESDRVTDDSVETQIDVGGIERSIVQSDIVGTGTGGTIETDAIETTPVEGEGEGLRFESHLVERRRYEDEITRRKRLTFDVEDVAVLDTETVESRLVDSDVIESEYDDDTTGRTGGETSGTSETAGTAGAVTVSEDDEGKTVVDDAGDTVGRVAEVRGDTLYVDPHSGFFERLEAALGWESNDDDTYPITTDQIAEIDGRRVVLKHAAEERIDDDH